MLDQTKRVARLKTPLGDNVLSISRLDASEGLSELFEFEIEALSEIEDIDFDKLIGKPCGIAYRAMGAPERMFHGVLTEGEWTGVRHDLSVYRLVLRPWLWLLGKTSDCRIFHRKTVVEIVEETFAGHGFSDFRKALTQTYPKLHYTVQYRETDLNFVCRLMEQHGIYWFFEHEADVHRLVLCDAPSSHKPVPGLASLPFNAHNETRQSARRQHLSSWNSLRQFRSGKVELNDYNHLKPTRAMLRQRGASEKYARADMEMYEHPGAYRSPKDGVFYAKVRLEAEQAQDRRREATGDAISLFPGALMTLEKHPRAPENRQYLIVRTRHHFAAQEYRSSGDAPDDDHGSYEFLPADRPFRALLATPKPLVHSLQTALVTGAKGEEIDCDDHGRILVHFYWDRHNDMSCRVRCNQLWGSKTWGSQIIPRIGMEVIVAFIDGDPDRPLVVGTVADPENNHVPYKLPDNKTRMVWRSNSHKSSGFNELTFEDKTGAENLHMHAQKDHTLRVKNNRTKRVDANEIASVGANRAVEVGGNQKHEVGGSMNLTVGGTGVGAMALMGQLTGLAGQTAGLLQQAGAIAGGGGAGLGSFAGTLAQSALGFLAGGGLGARQGVVAGADPRADAGTALAGSGDGVGQAASGLFPLSGIMNTVVGAFKSDSVGVAHTEQIGVAKVTNVGSTSLENVGNFKKIAVGDEFVIECGDSKFVMKKDGTVLIMGKTFNFIATDHVQIRGKPIDLN